MITALLVLILEAYPNDRYPKSTRLRELEHPQGIFCTTPPISSASDCLWGNAIGLGAIWIQDRFRILKFPNPQEYYIDYVPVHIDGVTILLLNIGVFGTLFVDALAALVYYHENYTGQGNQVRIKKVQAQVRMPDGEI